MKKTILLLHFLLCIFSQNNFAQNHKTIFFSKDSLKGYYSFNEKWKYSEGDDLARAQKAFDDSSWKEAESQLSFTNHSNTSFNGIAWFRLHFAIDSTVTGRPLAMTVSHLGASEIYLDGKLIKSFGHIGNPDNTVYFDPQELPFIFTIDTSREHVIAVRYANYNAKKNYDVYNNSRAGFKMMIGETQHLIAQKDLRSTVLSFVLMLLWGFFFSFCLIHFFMYLLNRTIKSNLYFSIFMFSLSSGLMISFINLVAHDPSFELNCAYFVNFVFVISCLSMSGFINELFNKNKLRFKIISFIGFAIILLKFFQFEIYKIITVALVITVSIEAVFTVVFSIIKKVKGAKIIGTGILFFTLFVLTIIIIAVFKKENLDIDDSTIGGRILIVFLTLAIISIPVSMSVYLAWNFSAINKNLSLQLEQVKVLSEKSIQQEKEKQKILETQNEILEQQVTLRTSEVVNQKEIVELKNKEITDSIEYALRIQTAILPPQKTVKQYLENSFILYKPKDIVAGDFYWMEMVNDLVLFAACDCTGHGVPGAMVSVLCHSALNRAVREFGLTQPAAILDKTAEIVIESFSKSEEEIKDGMDISLASIKYNKESKSIELEWAGANNPLWILKNNELIETKANKQSIGMNEDSKPFTNHSFSLTSGDSLYLFTDGYADQFGGETGEVKLTRKKLKELILSIHNKPMKEIAIILEKFHNDFKNGHEQTDDILVMCVKV